MRLVSKRLFDLQDPILMMSRRCSDRLFQTDTGEYVLHLSAEGFGDKLLRLNPISALAWLNATPAEYGIEWAEDC
jgi:hypothetical protein